MSGAPPPALRELLETEEAQHIRNGQHYWMLLIGLRLPDPVPEQLDVLDLSQLRTEACVCHICHQFFERRIAYRTCPGYLKDDPRHPGFVQKPQRVRGIPAT